MRDLKEQLAQILSDFQDAALALSDAIGRMEKISKLSGVPARDKLAITLAIHKLQKLYAKIFETNETMPDAVQTFEHLTASYDRFSEEFVNLSDKMDRLLASRKRKPKSKPEK
jgi:hypothetical protein